jgi:alanyl-tRNA synthetase
MTDRLYYTDATRLDFTAVLVASHDGGRRVVLDRSAFYPTSGGQPHDIGTLGGLVVHDVTEAEDGTVEHHLVEPLPVAVGESVAGHVDAARRFDHMQQHSGQHLLSAVLDDQFGWPTVSVHIGADGCALDLAADGVTPEALREAEQLANTHVFENRPITVGFEDAACATGLRKPSDRAGLLRIVTIAGLDRNACGGTHVAQTGAIGPILLRRTERTRGTVRVEFRCGHRALARARADMELALAAAGTLTAGVDELPTLVAGLVEARRQLEKAHVALTEQLLAHEARALHTAAPVDELGRRYFEHRSDDAPVKSQQSLAQQVVALGGAVYLAVSSAPPAVLLAASADTGLACGTLLRDALQAVGGRGGGTFTLAQGSAPSVEAALAARDALREAVRAPRTS